MVQLRRSLMTLPGPNRETVELCVVGPKSIIPKTVTVETYLSNTWLNFFIDELKLKVPLNKGIFICNTQYCPTTPKEGEGWRCELHEPISNYVNHFERRRNRYTVRIFQPSNFTNKRGRVSGEPQSRARSTTPGPNGKRTKSTPGNRFQRSRSVTVARSLSPQLRQPSILIPTTSNGSAVLTPRSQQSRYGTRQKRLHDQSILELNTPTPPPPEIPAKRPRQSRKQTLVPRLAEPTVVKQEVSQAEEVVPRINDVRSVLKIELPLATSINEQFYDEDDELETDVSSAGEDSTGSGTDANLLEGRVEQGNDHVEEFGGNERQVNQGQEMNGGDDFGTMSDSSEEAETSWARNDEHEEGNEEEEEEDDGMSMCTAVTQEEIQLRQEGIRVEDIKSEAHGRFNNFSNAYMLRIKNEIRKLRKNNHWIKNVEKSPLACFFLQELFKE